MTPAEHWAKAGRILAEMNGRVSLRRPYAMFTRAESEAFRYHSERGYGWYLRQRGERLIAQYGQI